MREKLRLRARAASKQQFGSDFDLGSGVGIPGVTAHRALTVGEDGPARLHPSALAGTTVLVAGGAGAVGNAAIQLARWAGATVIATVSNEAKAQLAAGAGADHVINYRQSDAAEQIRRIAPDGVQLIVKSRGARTQDSTRPYCARGGRSRSTRMTAALP